MKRFAICMILCMGLCGCGILHQTTYVKVEQHNENYEVSVDSDTITVNSYLSLNNAVLDLVRKHVENGVIRADSYRGDLSEDLGRVVHEAAEISPLGAFAVEHMAYDYSRIVSYYEIHIHTTFRRTLEEIQAVSYAANMDQVHEYIQEAMACYAPSLVLQVGDYQPFSLENAVDVVYRTHPEFALELPETAMEIYPAFGTQRVLEIQFSYRNEAETLLTYKKQLEEKLNSVSLLYGSANSEFVNARRLYERIVRDAELVPDNSLSTPVENSAYGALVERKATSYGFAQAYLLLLQACRVDGELVSGMWGGEQHDWCLLWLEDAAYYADPSLSVMLQNTDFLLLGNAELDRLGYLYSELPQVDLPDYFTPDFAEME